MKIVYIAGKFSGSNTWETECNIRLAEAAAFEVAKLGAMPMCPHANTRFFDGTLTQEFWYQGTLALLFRCDAMLLIEGWQNSRGARAEKSAAELRGIPCLESLLQLDKWLRRLRRQ